MDMVQYYRFPAHQRLNVGHGNKTVLTRVVAENATLVVKRIQAAVHPPGKADGAAGKMAVGGVGIQAVIADAAAIETVHRVFGGPPYNAVRCLADVKDMRPSHAVF